MRQRLSYKQNANEGDAREYHSQPSFTFTSFALCENKHACSLSFAYLGEQFLDRATTCIGDIRGSVRGYIRNSISALGGKDPTSI